jgi:hypothetical protein
MGDAQGEADKEHALSFDLLQVDQAFDDGDIMA